MKHKWKTEASENIFGLHVIHMNQWAPCHTYDEHSLILPHFFPPTQSFFYVFFSLTHEWILTHFFRALKQFCTFLFSLMNEWGCALSHIWISDCFTCHTIQVTLMNEWRLVLMSRKWGMSASLRCKWFMSHMWMSECHVIYMNEWALLMSLNSCHTFEWESVCLHVTMNGKVYVIHVTHMSAWVLLFAANESCHMYEWGSTRECVSGTHQPNNEEWPPRHLVLTRSVLQCVVMHCSVL